MEMQQALMPQQDALADAGRGTDNVMAHLSLGEIVIPRAMQDDPQFMEMLQGMFQQYGADINEFTVGHEANKINPETGYPEFFFRRIRNIVRSVSNAVLPTFGGPLGGAVNGLIQGDGLKGALGGAVQGGLNSLAQYATSQLGGALPDIFGQAAGSVLPGGVGPTQGTGISGALGRVTSSLPSLGSVLGGSSGTGGGSSFGAGNLISTALGGYQQDAALKKQRDQLAAANQQQLANLENLNPTNVQNDPGYQFAQQQGEQALNRSLGAQGNVFSGRALQAGSQFNQDLASRFYGDAYGRQAGKVGAQNAIYGNTGINNAAITGARADNISSSLSKALGGNQGMTLEEMRRLGLI